MISQRLILTLSLCLFPLTAFTADTAQPDMIFILIGQSNMAGRAPLEAGDDADIEGVLLLNKEGEWETAKNPLNRYASNRKKLSMQRIGPGDGFVRRIKQAFPNKTIGLVVNARGGSKIEEWGADQPYYQGTLKRTKGLPKDKLAGIIWHQGEGNANDPEYTEKMQEFVTRLRTTLKRPDLPFIVGEVYGDKPVNQHLSKIAETVPHSGCASAKDLTVFDGVHFDRESQKTLGTRYAEAWLEVAKQK